MLYKTTRNIQDPVTVQHVLTGSRGEDGGLYLPLHFPNYTEEERKQFCCLSFNQRMAEILNLFFSTKLTGWDLDFSTGRYPVRLEEFPHRIFLAECWHNLEGKYSRLEQNLLQLMGAQTEDAGCWVKIAVRMAVLAGIFGESQQIGDGTVDLVMVSGDFTVPISAWYLRKMGFPVGNIICCCNENNQLWELLCHGQLRTDGVAVETFIPEADVGLPVNLERLISECCGREETMRYLDCVSDGMAYTVSEAMTARLRTGIYVSVVSSDRVETAIPNVYHSYGYLMTPASALAYSGLMDYRSKTGITGPAVVFCDNSPACDAEAISKAMNMTPEELKKMI